MRWDNWGHGAGTWGGFIGDRRWNETFRVTLGDARLGRGVGLGDKWGHGAGTWGGFRTWGHGAGTWGGFRGPAWWIT